MPAVNSVFPFKLLEGLSAETSGGLLIAIPKEQAQEFCDQLEKEDGVPAWIIGQVTQGSGHAAIAQDVKIMEVETPQLFPE
eukprot:gene8767-1145_t